VAKVHATSGGIPWTELGFTTPNHAVALLDHSAMYLSHDAGRTFARVQF
jgi:hypothetical protein